MSEIMRVIWNEGDGSSIKEGSVVAFVHEPVGGISAVIVSPDGQLTAKSIYALRRTDQVGLG